MLAFRNAAEVHRRVLELGPCADRNYLEVGQGLVLPNRIGDWMERLSTEGVRGADLRIVFACIGPAMEIYSRYRKVEDGP